MDQHPNILSLNFYILMGDHMVAEGFLRKQHRELLLFDEDPAALLDAFAAYQAPDVAKWGN